MNAPAKFIYDNLAMELNVINAAHECGVEKLVFLSSVHSYPEKAKIPLKESSLLSGALEVNQEPYALAKLTGIKLCEFYNKQYNRAFIAAILCNIYGDGANATQVITMLCDRFATAVANNSESVMIWGNGGAKREFMHSDDLADALIFLVKNYEGREHINIGYGDDISISELAEMLRKISGFKGELIFDTTKPNGTLRTLLDSRKLNAMGWKPKISLEQGITAVYKEYVRIHRPINDP